MHTFAAMLLTIQPALGTILCPPDPAAWLAVPPAKSGYRELLLKASDSQTKWFVSLDAKNGRVVAERTVGTAPVRASSPAKPDFDLRLKDPLTPYGNDIVCFAKVEDGWLIGYNGGEWGGAIWWNSADGKKRYEVHKHCNPNQFIQTKNGLFAIEGLSHLGSNEGSVVQFTPTDGKWVGKEFAKLPAEGCAAVDSGGGTILVVTSPQLVGGANDGGVTTSTKLLRVTKDGKVETVLDVPDCLSPPTSVAIAPSGVIYVGMRQFVLMHDPKVKPPAFKLLVPPKESLKPTN